MIVLDSERGPRVGRRANELALAVAVPWHVEIDPASRMGNVDPRPGTLMIDADGFYIIATSGIHDTLRACSLDGNTANDRAISHGSSVFFTRWDIVADQGELATARFINLLSFGEVQEKSERPHGLVCQTWIRALGNLSMPRGGSGQ